MLTVQAIKPIIANGIITGYVLKDVVTGQEMNVTIENIISVMKNKQASFTNLLLTNDDKLVMKDEHSVNNVQTKEEQSETKEKIEENKVDNTESKSGSSKVDRMHYLVDMLNKARKVYEQGTDEIMSNFEYDKLYDELEQLEHELGTVMSNSPTINVGYEVVSELPKERHSQPMLSLAKTKDRAELASFLQGREGVLSWKLDGLTVVLTYENGDLVRAVTRGNGEIGEVVTNNAKQFKNVPRHIAFKNRLVLRGEAVIRYSTFEKINKSIVLDADKYKNPRNLCSGSVRQLDSSITASRNVEWYCFDVVECDGGNIRNNIDEQFNFIKLLGFQSVEYEIVNPSNIEKTIEKFENVIVNKKYDIPSDGLVLTFRDKQFGLSLGRTTKTPRHSIAFKWQDEEAESQLIGIEWQVGRTGIITPVAVFNPVDIEGSTVERASLHNLSILYDLLGQPYIGQKVKVYKANMIIPQISWGEKREDDEIQKIYIPSYCPCCGTETEIKEDPKSGVLTLWCTNIDCGAKGNRILEHFVTRDAMNIIGVSESTLETLSEAGLITDLASIYHLKDHYNEIINMEGFGDVSFYKMVTAIDKSRNVKLHNLIYALGIPNIGLATAKSICKNFGNDLAETVCATYDELINIEGIGDVIAESFVNYFADKDNADAFVRLVKELNVIKEEVSTNTTMAGVTICVTGDVYIFPNRRAIKDLVENLGGKLTGSVSKSTSYLVTNDTTSGSNKNKAAQAYGIPILTEQEFIDKFGLQSYIE